MRCIVALSLSLVIAACGGTEVRPPLAPEDQPIPVGPTKLGKADGFDWGSGCKGGTGTFTQQIDRRTVVTVGTIPKGKANVSIKLTSDEDIDVQLYDADGTKIIHWPEGILSGASEQTTTYKNVKITYSGYNGDGTNYGHESITLVGVTENAFVMKAYGYASGSAKIDYTWDAAPNCNEGGSGSFQQFIPNKAIVEIGKIPAGLSDVKIQLKSTVDVDVQLYDIDGTKIVHWPDGILNGADKQSTDYKGFKVVWSGYNGDGTGPGNETIELNGKTSTELVMKAYGYEAGEATVEYSWKKPGAPPTANTAVYVVRNVNSQSTVQGLMTLFKTDVIVKEPTYKRVWVYACDPATCADLNKTLQQKGMSVYNWKSTNLWVSFHESVHNQNSWALYQDEIKLTAADGLAWAQKIKDTLAIDTTGELVSYRGSRGLPTHDVYDYRLYLKVNWGSQGSTHYPLFDHKFTPPYASTALGENTAVYVVRNVNSQSTVQGLMDLFSADVVIREPTYKRVWVYACAPEVCSDLNKTLQQKGMSVYNWKSTNLWVSFHKSVHNENSWTLYQDEMKLTGTDGLDWVQRIKEILAIDTNPEFLAYRQSRNLQTYDVYDYRLYLKVNWGSQGSTHYPLYDHKFLPPYF